MKNLLPIKHFVDPALKEFTEASKKRLSCILIALSRIRGSWMKYFEDFVDFLKKNVEKQDPDLYIYYKYTKYLTYKLNKNITEGLFKFLESKGYGENELWNIEKTYNERAFINRLPQTNAWFFWICIFYLYQPGYSQKFFWEELEYVLEDEKTLLSNYRVLPLDMQEKVAQYMKNLADGVHISELK